MALGREHIRIAPEKRKKAFPVYIGASLKKGSIMAAEYADYLIFVLLFAFKLYWFAKLTGNVFTDQRVLYYLRDVFSFILHLFNESERTGLFKKLLGGNLLATVGTGMLFSFWTLFFRAKTRRILLSILNVALTFCILADLLYYSYFHDFISVAVLLQWRQVGSLGGSIKSLFDPKDVFLILDIAVVLPILILFSRKRNKLPRRQRAPYVKTRLIAASMAFLAGFLFVFTPIYVFLQKGGSWLFEKTISNTRIYNLTGLFGFHLFDIYQYAGDHLFRRRLTEERLEEMKRWYAQKREDERGQASAPYFGAAKGKNVMIVQLEAFESFVIGKTINGQEITPNLNRLMKETFYFDRFYHQTGTGRTSDAEFLANTSLYPIPDGSAYIRFPRLHYSSLPKALKEEGYTTHVFHAYDKNFWNRYLVYPNIGIDHFHSIEEFDMTDRVGWSISDESMLMQSIQKIKTLPQPYYAFLITLSSHHPFDLPDQLKKLDLRGYGDVLFKDYIQAVHYVDFCVGKMIDSLKAEGLWDDTLLVMYGDHDSGLPREGGDLAKFLDDVKPARLALSRHSIPLYVKIPGQQGGKVFHQAGGQIDIAPTVLHLLGQPGGAYMMGTSLFSQQPRFVVFRNGSFTDGRVFYDASLDGEFANGTCFDLETEQQTELERCKPGYDRMLRDLSISDDLILGNGFDKLNMNTHSEADRE